MIGIYNNAKEGSQKTLCDNNKTITESNHFNQLYGKDYPQFAQGLLFLHARNFSLMEPDIQSQFYTYVPSKAKSIRDLSLKHVPHIKSYCRIAAPSCSSVTSDCNSCICYPLRWAVITSACLSRGIFIIRSFVSSIKIFNPYRCAGGIGTVYYLFTM